MAKKMECRKFEKAGQIIDILQIIRHGIGAVSVIALPGSPLIESNNLVFLIQGFPHLGHFIGNTRTSMQQDHCISICPRNKVLPQLSNCRFV